MKIKNYVWDVVMVVLFAVISILYFWNPIMDGKELTGTDHSGAVGLNAELDHYRDTHDGARTRWIQGLFSGMPTYQISPSYNSTDTLNAVETVYQLWLPTVAAYVFMMLLGFYILLRAFDFRQWMAALGAVLWAFSSYYFIIIAAGHIWKLLTLCFIPPTIAGVVLCYRGKYLWGTLVTALFTALQIFSNHVQMSYYFLLVMLLMVIAFAVQTIRTGQWRAFLKASACALVGGILGIAINLSNLYHTYQYSKESMRGKSELTQQVKDQDDQTSSGLERSYITAWSYGVGETWTLLVPNTKGGASVPLTYSKEAMNHARQDFVPLYRQMGQYWGEQPGTSGPVYVGAFVMFLFVLGLFVVKGPMKWALLVATVLSILLSWGKNFMPFTDFFLDYVPMYDKFRTVASILVIAEFTIPLLAMLALKRVVDEKDFFKTKTYGVGNAVWSHVALALTGGVCLLFYLMPDVFFGSYISSQETEALKPLAEYGWPLQDVMNNLSEMRRAMFTADAMRSLIVILVGFIALMVYRWKRINGPVLTFCLLVLCLADMWGVNKRYLNDGMFVNPRPASQSIPATVADEVIQQDGEKGRVLNLTVSTFNDNTTSYRHQSIGGYHAAKLRRYQELIENHITPEIRLLGDTLGHTPVLDMLNTRYIIVATNERPYINPDACGHAWFADEVKYVKGADAELLGLKGLDTRHVAVADSRFEGVLGQAQADSTATAELTEHDSDRMVYKVNSKKGGVVVFSEIFYPGWTVSIDGKEAGLGRVNYVLRALRVEPGEHTVEMLFRPQSVRTTEAVAFTSLGLLALLLVWQLVSLVRGRKK